ncbi:MAG: GxxExxY protein [Phycisphaerales bacterium]
MNADQRRSEEGGEGRAKGADYAHSDITDAVISAFYDVYNELGHGFLESVYANALAVALSHRSLKVEREVAINVCFQDVEVGVFKADLIVAGVVLVELKAARELDPVHTAQVLNYLRATRLEVGLLFNFGPKPAIRRFAYANSRKRVSPKP